MKHNYKRTITDTDYTKIPEKYNSTFNYIYSDGIRKFTLPLTFNNVDKKNVIIANDNYLIFNIEREYKLLAWFYPIFPGLLLLAFLLPLFNVEEETPFYAWVWIFTFSTIIIGILVYQYKRPKKEYIFDRLNGVITFPDYAWKTNNTMPFEKIMWSAISTKGSKGGGTYFPKLAIRSPKTFFYLFTSMIYFHKIGKDYLSNSHQYKDELSLLIWYMDKNRPLPPGDIFDEFREKDFERRKANGFPKPLFPYSHTTTNKHEIKGTSSKQLPPSTPESTPEQQSERQRIGGW
ncbi:hypothetical protein [Aquimarina pacifica]|uniref:hypothetical protein n=1 Tax=Aquimarina pacifica TaxID=1296415 RepID=UPI00046EB19E|nr:hypothetical protein [Aquimarina pacifica]